MKSLVEPKECRWCRKPFKRQTRKWYYCSRECFVAATKAWGIASRPAALRNHQRCLEQRTKVPKIRYTAAYKRFRESVLARADFKCELCGGTAIDIHHKVPICVDSDKVLDEENGLALCLSCHRSKHKDLPDEMFKKRSFTK